MNCLTFFRILKKFFLRLFIEIEYSQPKISILIPFSSTNPVRKAGFEWLLEYWKHELPDAEIVVGHSNSDVFCKGEALNDAARRSSGKIIVMMDADAYIYGDVIEMCADRILETPEANLWYVPYRHLYRLTKKATQRVLASDPEAPYRFPSPPNDEDIENQGHTSKYGHRYGAMCMIFPREALNIIGCFDERFKGWGSEDIALLRALDILYGKHKTTNNDILHLWHPMIGGNYQTRKWEGQSSTNPNNKLAIRYHKAAKNPAEMRKLMDEAFEYYINKKNI